MSGSYVSLLLLNKDGVNELINKSRKVGKKKQLLEWLENNVYSNSEHPIMRIYKNDHEAPKIFKSNPYNKYKKKQKQESRAFKYEKTKSEAIKEALEDAEINYYGLDDQLSC